MNYSNTSIFFAEDMVIYERRDELMHKQKKGVPSQDKPWLKYYSEQNIEIQLPHCKIYDLVHENNKEHPQDVALIYYGKKITYAELFDNIEITARAFATIGICAGDTVVISSANIPEVIYSFYALNRLGAIVNMVDPRTDLEHTHEYFQEMNTKAVVCIDAVYPRVIKAIKETSVKEIIVVSPADSLPSLLKVFYKIKNARKRQDTNENTVFWKEFLKKGEASSFIDAKYKPGQVCVVAHTGGTTGKPKSVLLTDDNLNAVTYGYKYLGIPFKRGQVYFNDLPPFIMYGLVLGIHTTLTYGLKVVTYPLFDSQGFPKQFAKYKPQHFSAVPEHLRYLIESPIIANMNLEFLISPGVGGDSVNVTLEKQVNEFLSAHGCQYEVCKGYGMTELAATACITFKGANALGSIGIPFITNNFKIVNTDTGEECSYNEIGEIWISGPSVMKGYYKDDEATRQLFEYDENGTCWVKTGDLGLITEEGLIFHKGRIRRIYLTDFENQPAKMYPLAVEEKFKECIDVQDCCVVGRKKKDSSSYELVAFVVKTGDAVTNTVVEQMLHEIAQKSIPSYMHPVEYRFLSALPHTPIGKIDFRKLEIVAEVTN